LNAHYDITVLSRVRRSPYLPTVLALAYLVVPVRGWGLLEGRPLGLLSTVALAGVCWLWAGPRRDRLTRPSTAVLFGVALALKLGLGLTLLVPRGFEARYYASPTFDGPVELSAEPAGASITRIDRRLRLGFDGAPDVPLPFFNDLRYGFFRDTDPKRDGLPFSINWQGLWRVTAAGRQRIYVHSPGGAVNVAIGDVLTRHIEPTETWTGDVDLPRGFHRVMIAWSVPQDGARRFEAGWIIDGRETPFDERAIFGERASSLALAADAVVRGLSWIVDAALLAWLTVHVVGQAAGVWRSLRVRYTAADAVSLAWLLGIFDAIVFAAPALGRMVTLSGGDDWLTYESQARDIVLHGLLMTGGAAPGRGSPFFAQPFYAYCLAACHWLFGDGLWGIYFVQRLSVAATIIAMWRATAIAFDEKVGFAALVTGVAVAYQKLAGWSGVLLTEVLFTPLVAWWAYLLVRLGFVAADPREGARPMRLAALAGSVGALATLTRSSLLTGWVLALPLVAIAIPRRRGRLAVLAVVVSAMLAATSLATLRNWVVAHKLVLITSEGAQAVFLGNPPPALDDTPPAVKAWYARFNLDPRVEKVAEFARQKPGEFTAGLVRKGVYTLGWFGTMLDGAPTSHFYIAVWMLALAGVCLLPWIRPKSLPLALVPLALAASHFVAMVLIMPQVYVDRTIVPMYLLLVPSAALPIAALGRIGAATLPGREAPAVVVALLAATVFKMLGWLPGVDFDVLTVALLVAAVCLAGLPSVNTAPLLVYAVYEAALLVLFFRSPSADSAAALRSGSLLLATLLVCASSVNGWRAAVGWTILALAALGAAALLAPGIPGGAAEQFAQSLRNAFGYTSSYSAAAGFVCAAGALIARTRAPRLQRALIYAAGAALMLPALHWVGAMITPERALFERELATIGVVGVIAYALIWIEAAWPAGSDLPARACEGMALGAFATVLFGTVIGHAGAASTVAAGVLIGVIQAERGPARARS
jgi:hypothetical protein